MQIKDKLAKIDRYLIPIILGVFVVFLTSAFIEHALYFKETLLKTFSTPPPPAPVAVDLTTLAEVARAVNINEKDLRLLSKDSSVATKQTEQPSMIAPSQAEIPPQALPASSTTVTQVNATNTIELKKPSR